jgi:hypothetical protein
MYVVPRIIKLMHIKSQGSKCHPLETSIETNYDGPPTGPEAAKLDVLNSAPDWFNATQEVEFVSQWLVPNSTDFVQTYSWGTTEAIRTALLYDALKIEGVGDKEREEAIKEVENRKPVYEDSGHHYYRISLERAKKSRSFPQDLIEEIQRSEQWQKEQALRADDPIDELCMTECLTVGFSKKSMNSRCILYVMVGGREGQTGI